MMRKILLCLILFMSYAAFSQSVNDYQYVLVPTKFSFSNENDKYRLNTTTKFLLQKYGFKSFFTSDSIPGEIVNNNCKKLFADVVADNNLFTTKVKVVLKDCKDKVVYETNYGSSREKEYKVAYNEALRNAFKSFDNLDYKYNGKNDIAVVSSVTIEEGVTMGAGSAPNSLSNVNPGTYYFAQPIANGFQIVDNEPKVIMRLLNTSQKNVFIAQKGTVQGVVFLKNNQWFFEYYENSKLISEPLNLRF